MKSNPTNTPQDAVERVELLPCPFPHEVKRGPFIELDTEDFGFVRVSCSDCGCAGPFVTLKNPERAAKSEKAEAINLWNTRSLTKPDEEKTGFVFWANAAKATRLCAEQPMPVDWADIELRFLRQMEKAPDRAAIKAITLDLYDGES